MKKFWLIVVLILGAAAAFWWIDVIFNTNRVTFDNRMQECISINLNDKLLKTIDGGEKVEVKFRATRDATLSTRHCNGASIQEASWYVTPNFPINSEVIVETDGTATVTNHPR